ncbi:MAG: RsmE family RNA methyltransferase [Verrucomicrobiota bacterium]|jgi:16S rRNA (uracil1498-N3)-methyltransferase
MNRFYLAPEKCGGPWLQLGGREAHHALHVLRLKPGDAVTVLDGAGRTFLCEARPAERDSLTLAVQQTKFTTALPCPITLLVAVPKGKIVEDIIQKSAELGVQRVIPLLTERVVTQLDPADAAAKREKWQQVAVEAIKQCGAAWLPQIETPQTIQQYLNRGEHLELVLVGSLQTERRHPREWIHEFRKQHGRPPESAGVWIGPEGDFTLAELQSIEAAGAKPITLGELTLRVETAAIFCLSFLNYELRPPPAR